MILLDSDVMIDLLRVIGIGGICSEGSKVHSNVNSRG